MSHLFVCKMLAPAKLNLSLIVGDLMQNGLHEIESLIIFVDLCDSIEICESQSDDVQFSGHFAGGIDHKNNSIYKALEFFRQQTGIKSCYNVKVIKNIPVGAGLGGESTDAAAIIHGLVKNFGIKKEKFYDKVFLLGSDVGACYRRTGVFVSGTGDKIQEIKTQDKKLFILLAKFYQRTSLSVDAYRLLDEVRARRDSNNVTTVKRFIGRYELDLTEFLQLYARNDFFDELFEGTEEWIVVDFLKSSGALFASMTGSGTAIYGIFDNEDLARICNEKLHKQYEKMIWTANTKIFHE